MSDLRIDEPQKVAYCIPLWLRDEQIRLATKRVKGRIQPHYELRAEPIAVACYGPSLNDTWEKLRDFRYVVSCSGAHRFLVEHGIRPTWHVEVDPRPHKVELIGPPQQGTKYLIASTCHPKVFDHLEGFDVELWHVYDASADGSRLLPRGEWAITGGCDAGLRAMTIAAFLGFRELHVFGMDGSAREEKHAGPHPNGLKEFSTVRYEGVSYKTTPGMLAAAQTVWHELEQMPSVQATFYGEGLIQHMARLRPLRPPAEERKPLADVVAMSKPELISAEYRELNARLHVENVAYGVGGAKHTATVLKLRDAAKAESILDYGCGKGLLAKTLPFPIWEYDPAIPGKDELPKPADLVVCTDVLEHIEPDKLLPVLDDLRRVTRKVGYFVIHTGPSSKKLSDGRNTHLLQHDRRWWEKQLSKFFQVGKVFETPPLLTVVVGPRLGFKKVA